MKKIFKNKNITYNIILIILAVIIMFFIARGNLIYGSKVDWLKQHVTFSNYFRNLFYNNHNLFPDFSLNLAAGQNIFYFSYYGLLSPIIIFSYLVPFISMENYIMISSGIIVIISAIMFYYLLLKNNYSKEIALFTSILFLLSNGFLFHSHRHIMFMNYMPFLLLGLFSVHNYIENKKSILLIISIALMIMTSYYFSVIGLVTIFLYYLFKTNEINIKKTCIFISRMILGILLASLFLLPVIYVIRNGRSNENINILFSYFIPQVNSKFLLYDAYGVGSISLLWISLIYNIIFKKSNIRLVSIFLFIIIIFPIINLLLNGGLYLNGKIFIPFTPLFLILIANMINDIKKTKIRLIWLNLGVILSILFIKFNSLSLYMILDLIITLILLNIYNHKKKQYLLLPIILIAITSAIIINTNDDLLTNKDIKELRNITDLNTNNYFDKDNIIYRYHEDINNSNIINYSHALNDYRTTIYSSTSNNNYLNTYKDSYGNNNPYRNSLMLSQRDNLFFDRFIGIKYLLKENNEPYGYKEIKKFKNMSLYKNDNVYPIAFSKTNILSEDIYNELDYNQKLEAFNNNIITNNTTSDPNLNFISKKITLDYTIIQNKNLSITKDNDSYTISSNGKGKLVLGLNQAITNKSLIINFKMNKIASCPNDLKISINDIKNTLTCKEWKYFNNNYNFEYVVSSNNPIDKLNINFSAGDYNISDISVYEIDNSFFISNDINPLNIKTYNKKHTIIDGNITQIKDGYFIFTIPYDKGFSVYLDNKKIDYEKVNNSFIGFPIAKGNHYIKLKFNAPYFKEGKIISLIILITLIPLNIYEKKRNKV